MDDVTHKGGTEPQQFPHMCAFSLTGSDRKACVAHSSLFQRNAGGCSRLRCNSGVRRCMRCIEIGRGSKANAATNPATGMCDEHSVAEQKVPNEKWLKPTAAPKPRESKFAAPPPAPAVPRAPARPTPAPKTDQRLLGTKAKSTNPSLAPDSERSLGKRNEGDGGPLLGKRAENPQWRQIIARVRKAIAEAVVVKLPPERFRPMPDQPRDYFDPDELASLQASIEEVGQIQDGLCRGAPLVDSSDHELLDGERRWRCISAAELPEYRAKRVEIDDEAAPFLVAAIANFNRPEHTPLEKSNVINRLFNHTLAMPMVGIAKLLGISAPSAYKLYSLQRLPQEVRDMIDPRKHAKGADLLPLTAAYEIARLDDPKFAEYQKDFGRRVFTKQLPRHKLQAEVDRILAREDMAVVSERNQPARLFTFVERKVDLMFAAMDAAKDRVEDMKANGTLPDDASRLDGDMNRLIKKAKEVIALVGGEVHQEHRK